MTYGDNIHSISPEVTPASFFIDIEPLSLPSPASFHFHLFSNLIFDQPVPFQTGGESFIYILYMDEQSTAGFIQYSLSLLHNIDIIEFDAMYKEIHPHFDELTNQYLLFGQYTGENHSLFISTFHFPSHSLQDLLLFDGSDDTTTITDVATSNMGLFWISNSQTIHFTYPCGDSCLDPSLSFCSFQPIQSLCQCLFPSSLYDSQSQSNIGKYNLPLSRFSFSPPPLLFSLPSPSPSPFPLSSSFR